MRLLKKFVILVFICAAFSLLLMLYFTKTDADHRLDHDHQQVLFEEFYNTNYQSALK